MKRSALKRKPMKRKRIRRDWSDAQPKIVAEGRCRGCGRSKAELSAIGRPLQAAHIVGCIHDAKSQNPRFDRYVHPDSVFPLCGPATDTGTCHNEFDSHRLDLWARLTDDERAWVEARIGAQAQRSVQGRTQ